MNSLLILGFLVVFIIVLCYLYALKEKRVPLDVRNLPTVGDTHAVARERVLDSNYLADGGDVYKSHAIIPPPRGTAGDPYEDLAYNKFDDCRKLRVLWLEGENGKLYPIDIFPQSSYRADRPNQDYELAKLLGRSRDRMQPLFTPDHVKLTN